ncbi:MAG: hypothetical protein FVQ80_14470 [Planctomycetes bacterium]|nr:hypothetical protein [Planctomycetota bacterium]
MRIVMPLFDFSKESSEEYMFSGGKYALRRFDVADEVPDIELFSERDIGVMEFQSWALVAEAENLEHYKEEINRILLSFKIYKLARVFIKYRLCKEDIKCCSILNDYLHIVMPDESNRVIALNDLDVIDKGFSKLLQMDTISNRTHNAIYFMYRGFCAHKMIDSFVLLMCAIESLFSNECRSGATRTICSRVSKFLDCKSGYGYEDIEELYNLRSKIVHGKVVVEDEIKGQLSTLYKVQYVLVECMKKMLDKEIYRIYSDVQKKECYFNDLR